MKRQQIGEMRISVCLLIGAVVAGGLSSGQNRAAFEVASVKPSDPAGNHPIGTGVYTYPGGRVVASNCTLAYLIQEALAPDGGTGTHEFAFPDAPGWYTDERFDIDSGPFENGIAGINISMAQFARRLTLPLGRPVLDRTGLTGFFDFEYQYTSDDQSHDVIGSILASIQGLGLKLEPSTAPVETIVIEHAEKPSAN